MRPLRLLTVLSALALFAGCTSSPTAPVTASERPSLTGGYTSSGNAVPAAPDDTTSTPSDTVTARGPGYLGSGL